MNSSFRSGNMLMFEKFCSLYQIFVTEEEIMICFNDDHSEKAEDPIILINDGMIMALLG